MRDSCDISPFGSISSDLFSAMVFLTLYFKFPLGRLAIAYAR